MNDEPTSVSWRGRRTQLVAGAALVIALGVVLYLVLANNSGGANSRNGRASGTYSGSTTVQRRNLVQEDTESGTLSYAGSYTVYNRLSGTVTWLPTAGTVIKPGQALFRVDNRPVLLMDGATPAYRNLTSADKSGPDVLELNANLVALGYDPDGIIVNDDWQAATTAGIKALQYAWGETETGELTLGQVDFLPGNQLVSSVLGTVGSAVRLTDPTPHPEFVSLENPATTGTTGTTGTGTTGAATTPTTPDTTTGTPTTSTGATGTTTTPTTSTPATNTTPSGSDNLSQRTLQALLRLISEQQRALAQQHGSGAPSHSGTPSHSSQAPHSSGSSKSPSSSSSTTPSSSGSKAPGSSDGGGGGGGNPTALIDTTSTQLVVTVDLSASSQSEAVVGGQVTVEMPNGSTVPGTITAVSAVASSSSGDNGSGSGGGNGNGSGASSSSSTVPVTITLNRHVSGKGLDQAAVSVNFVQERASNVLSVPVTALLATSGSSYAVQEAAAPHKLIPVTTGLFAAGDVQISGPGIYPGLQVTDSQG